MDPREDSILQYESTLRRETLRRIQQIGDADVLIGIPTHRNARTVGPVIKTVLQGIQAYMQGYRVVLMNADGGSSDATVRHFREASLPSNTVGLWTVYEGLTGKGTAIRSIWEAAGRLGVRACLVIEARAPGIRPEWLPALVTPVLQGDDIAMGCYQRRAYDAALTDNLVYPFLCAFLRADLREPLAGEFCVSGELAMRLASQDVWETNTSRFGVNVWLATFILAERLKISQVDLGYRGPSGGDPGTFSEPRFLNTFGVLFRFLTLYRRAWMTDVAPITIPFRGPRAWDVVVPPSDECLPILIEAFHEAREIYGSEWEATLTPETLEELKPLFEHSPETFSFPDKLWAHVVYDFATVYNRGEGDPDKVAEALLPLFYARTAAYIIETHGLPVRQREARVQQLAETFIAERPYFDALWQSYQDWEDDVTRYWFD